jgi:hypothetical protein
MTPKEKEALVIASIKAGADTRKQIEDATGFSYGTVGNYLHDLYSKHHVRNFRDLQKILVSTEAKPTSEPAPKKFRRFPSRNGVWMDEDCPVSTAASMLVQVLGKQYCSKLIDALMVACVPGAPGEEKD